MHLHPLRRVVGALCAAALAAVLSTPFLVPAAASAAVRPAASTQGGKITADEVLARLKNWYDRKIPYSQSGYAWDIGKTHKYRTDCSGYADMALHTVHDWNTDSLATADSFHRVMNVTHDNRNQLNSKTIQTGDVFDDTVNGHAFIFASWSSADPHKFYYYNFGGGSSGTAPPEHHSGYVTDDEFGFEPANNDFVLRYDNIIQPSDPIKE